MRGNLSWAVLLAGLVSTSLLLQIEPTAADLEPVTDPLFYSSTGLTCGWSINCLNPGCDASKVGTDIAMKPNTSSRVEHWPGRGILLARAMERAAPIQAPQAVA